MSNKIRYCLLCERYDGRTKHIGYTRIYTVEREEKLREGYRRRYNGQEINQPLLNQIVHKKCYNKIIQYIPSVDESIPSNDVSISNEQNHDEEQDQAAVVQSRSRAVLPANVKSLLERSQRACIVCHSYKYSRTNRMKQIVSNFMANKLAAGFLRRYKRPYGKSLLDAYIHASCYRKLYGSYRYQTSRTSTDRSRAQYQTQMISQSLISPHETRNRTNLNKSDPLTSKITTDEPGNLSIEDLFSAPFAISVATTNPNAELSARSCLFRPCLQRLSPEEIEFYTKRNTTSREINEDNSLISDELPVIQSSITQPLTTNDSMIYSDEEDLLPVHSIFNKQPKISTVAEIRYRSSKSITIDHNYIPNIQSKKPSDELDQLYHWLIDQLQSSEYPISISEVVTKYQELTKEEINPTKPERLCRIRLRNRLEKLYPNEFLFVVPNKRDGTFIALNNIDHYVRFAIKKAQQDKEVSLVPSVVIPPTPKDYRRETCEAIMNGIRKIRLYIRDSKQINGSPSLLMQNFIGLLTTSEKQFERISHDYDFYRMIDENLFEHNHEKVSNKLDKTVRNLSLASDLISARHDHQISQKHYLLADEISKESFHCTPRQVITLLNRYGHTCSYKSYHKMKKLVQKTTNELGERLLPDEENSSDSELDLIEL